MKGLQKAEELARQILERARAGSLEQAVAEFNERLRGSSGGAQAQGPASEGGAEAASPGGPQQAGNLGPLEVKETDFVSRRSAYIREAFRLGDGEFGLVTERGFGAACYVVEKLAEQAPDAQGFLKRRAALRDSVLRRKRQRAVESWLEHLLKESPPPRSMKA